MANVNFETVTVKKVRAFLTIRARLPKNKKKRLLVCKWNCLLVCAIGRERKLGFSHRESVKVNDLLP